MSACVSGARAIAAALEQLGITHAFGMPGTQNIDLFEALRAGRGTRLVLCAHELGAAFMANGYFRACGRPGVVLTIPGAGLTYALTGLAEAKLDSAAVLHVVCSADDSAPGRPAGDCASGQPADDRASGMSPGERIDEESIAAAVVKEAFALDDVADIGAVTTAAYRAAVAGEPGPVLLRIAQGVLTAEVEVPARVGGETDAVHADDAMVARVRALLAAARKPLLFVGQGAAGAAGAIRRLAERHGAAVLTTTSGRGLVPEDHPLALGFDFLRHDAAELNAMLAGCDLVVAVGCKFSSNGTGGYVLELPEERLVTINTAAPLAGDHFPARLALQARAEDVVDALLSGGPFGSGDNACSGVEIGPGDETGSGDQAGPGDETGGWTAKELSDWRARFETAGSGPAEPRFRGPRDGTDGTAKSFFEALRRCMPRDAILVTDSGLHQVLARRHFRVLAPRGFIVPSDFQSMGFGIPAAIGAWLAAPDRPVVGLIGDGGLIVAGLELLTAVREQVPLTLIVFNDGQLNLIRMQQLERYGRATAVKLTNPDLETFAASLGAAYVSFDRDGVDALADAVRAPRTTIVEVRLGDTAALRRKRAKGTLRRLLGSRGRRAIKRLLSRD